MLGGGADYRGQMKDGNIVAINQLEDSAAVCDLTRYKHRMVVQARGAFFRHGNIEQHQFVHGLGPALRTRQPS